ncbi:hypothetical protein HDU86_003428 [Geranomyces michiganensis]|nr:hypothetical protein HDU86_003428 [Geranomyces michiganensis]
MPPTQAAVLKGHCRRKVLNQAYPGMIVNETEQVDGLVVHVDKQDVTILDIFESNDYERRTVEVEVQVDGTLRAEKVDAYFWRDPLSGLSITEEWSFEEFTQSHVGKWVEKLWSGDGGEVVARTAATSYIEK